ncbi:TonB-dependent receptor plug domain-containing protein [uncultured Alistipes sp.]|uniref:TonB-dependent receptor n=1 Tax=uncultured Alistipes sp. TaxID=538949 RepID=UPI0025E9A715|nr:TonB-dependent receptor plug domain-containing protein [uncultured Alistipes sp.]
MKRFSLTAAALALCLAAATAAERSAATPARSDDRTTEQAQPEDSVRMIRMQQVEVTALRADARTPVAYADLEREAIARNAYGTDIPSLLALTPSMVATNETGIGIGSTAVRLRGTDPTRINVTINGVAMNNPDSHSMYWYDTPDLLSSVGTIQVQRGAGLSTNGTGAFGGAVNMTTDALRTEFGGSASLSYGSYNTQKQAVHIASGLMGGHWTLDARLTHIGSDGYVERGATDLKSYMFQAGYYGGRTMLKLLSFGGKARTGLTYTGATKEEMRLNGRRFNPEGMYTVSGGLSHRVWHGDPPEWKEVAYYDDQTDNYLQINNQLVASHVFNARWRLNATAFYTYGYGYYKQYKDDAKLNEYPTLAGVAFDDGGNRLRRDLIREKLMRNHLGGINASALYAVRGFDLAFGGSYSYYTCPHWGELDWVEGIDASHIGGRWYDNDVRKQDANLFAKADWRVARGLHLFADLQYRYVRYEAWGVNDNWVDAETGMQPIDVDRRYHFFNPRAGLSYTAGRHRLFGSFAVAQREPTRSDFTDRYRFAADDSYPSSERLYDFEIGYRYEAPRVTAGVNLYYMKYKDQLVPTGMVNDGSDVLNVNVPNSYRSGVELTASWRATDWLTASANATFSQNRIEDYVDMLADSPTYGQNLGDMTIAYSPSAMGSLLLDFHRGGFGAVLHTQVVGRQYFTNNENDALSLGRYCVTNLDLMYTLRMKAARSVRFGVKIFNLFDQEYCSNGYGYSYMDTWSEATPRRIDMAYYFAQAPLHVLGNVTVNF